MPAVAAPTRELLEWIAAEPRTYAKTIEVWKSSCPRLTIWEDAVADRLVHVERGRVLLTPAGAKLLKS